MNDIERLLILNMVDEVGSIRTRALLRRFGSFGKALKAKEADIAGIKEIGPRLAPKIVKSIEEIDIKKEIDLISRYGVKVMSFLDDDYPKHLKEIHSPPVILYIKGKILPQDETAVAIVGSRRASFYGMQTAEKLGFELALRGITVVSGLARGIDSSAHKGALKAKGRTIAILGSGQAHIYPKEHKALAEEISKNGAVISEFPMATIPDKSNFPKRNRVISGLSLGVVVVEAAEKSGALITADFALEEGKEVFAVPGKVDSDNSRGTNRLIKQGARLIESVDDVLEELNLEQKLSYLAGGKDIDSCGQKGIKLDKCEVLVYNLLSSEPRYIDELSEAAGMNISDISRILLNLEMRKFIRQLPGKNFVRL